MTPTIDKFPKYIHTNIKPEAFNFIVRSGERKIVTFPFPQVESSKQG